MNDPLQELLAPGALRNSLFPPTSRYYGIDVAVAEDSDGRTIAYLRRRFLPSPERLALVQEYRVSQGDRPDTVAAQFFGDPELFWRLCDANAVMSPEELTESAGRWLRITLPEGIPGAGNA